MFAHLTTAKLKDLRDQTIQELTVVRNDDGSTVEGLDSFFQHILRWHVEVVGRLVENQQVHGLQQQTNHSQSTTLTTTKHLDLFVSGLASKHKGP